MGWGEERGREVRVGVSGGCEWWRREDSEVRTVNITHTYVHIYIRT